MNRADTVQSDLPERSKGTLTRFTENRSIPQAIELYEQRMRDAEEIYARFHAQFVERGCPACGRCKYSNAKRFLGKYGVAVCAFCQTQFVNPCPDSQALSAYYNECKSNILLDNLYRERMLTGRGAFVLNNRLATVERLLKDRLLAGDTLRVLEVGCGSGSNLANLKAAFDERYPAAEVSYVGVDLDANAIASSVDPSLDLRCADAAGLAVTMSGAFDVILHFELIEHLPDPIRVMREIGSVCAPSAFMVFTTPNARGLEMLIPYDSVRLLAHAIFPPMHLNAYSVQNVAVLASVCGYELFEVSTPGSLDVDLVNVSLPYYAENALLVEIAALDEAAQVVLQKTCQALGVSSHMQCIFRAPA